MSSTQETFVHSGIPREACFDLGDVKVENDIVTFNEQEDEDILVRGSDLKLNAARCFTGTLATVFFFFFFTETLVASDCRVKGALTRGDVKEEKAVVTFSEEQDEDTLVAEGHQIGRGTVFLRDTCQREIHQRNIRDKRFPP